MGKLKLNGWGKRGYNPETHKTKAHADAARINARLGGRRYSENRRMIMALEVGEYCTLPYKTDASGARNDRQEWARALVRAVELATGRTFYHRGETQAISIQRRS